MSNWLQLYGNLQRNLATSYTGSQQSVRIPNTVIFHRRKPILWFQTPAKGHGVLERKSNSGGIEVAQVFRTFIDNASCPIVATMIWYCEKAAMPSTFGDLKLKHLDEQQLRSLLLHTVKGLILPAYWILQGFIGPGNDGHVSTIVSESLGSSKKYSAIISKNRHAFGSFSKIHEACLTVESADTKHSRLEKINDKFLNEAVIDVSDIACRCCASVDQSIGVTFFFRVDKSNLLWLLWCSIPQQQIQKKVIPRAINSHDNHTVINDRSRTFLLHSNCCEILEAAFSAQNGIIQVTICDDEKRQQEESFFLMIKYDEEVVTYEKLIDLFWSTITSTEDSGSEYETSVIYYSTAQQQLIAESSAWRNAQSRISLGLAVLQHQVTIQPISADLRLIPCSIPVDKPESESEHVHDNNKIPFQSSSSTRKSDTNGREESQDDERVQYRQATINADKKMALRHSTAPPRRKNSILPVKRKGRRGGRGGSGTQRESRSGDGHRKPRKVSIKEIADVIKTVDDEIRFEDDRDVTAKLTASKNLTVGDVAVRPKSLSFNNTRLALLCNPKGDYIKPLPSVTSTKTGTEKRLLYDNNGPEILEGSALEATEHALMRLRLEIKDLQLDIVKSHRASESVPFKAKPPVGRASSFPTTRSRSSQLSKNRYAKDVELSEAVPTIVDPVIIIKPPKPIPIEIPIQVIGSMPLEFSKKFGDFGRRTKAVADGQLKIKGPAPPGQAEDLMDITSEIVRKVCGNLIKLLSGSCEAARKHRDLLIHEQLTKNTKIQSNKLFPFENDVVDEGFTRDKIVSDTVCKVEESLRNRIGENDAIDGPQKYGNDINIEFVYKKKTPVPENDNTNLDTNKIQKIQENNDAEGVPEDGGSNDKKKENFSEKSFLGLIKQMSCVPNHRPVEELCTVLLWLLASGSDGSSSSSGSKSDREDDMTDANGTIKSVSAFDSNQTSIILEAFSQYAKHAKACLTEVTHIQADRGPNNEKDSRVKWRSALSLRTWHCERDRPIPMENIRSRVLTGSLEFNSGNDRGSGGSRGGSRGGSSERNGQRSRGSGRCEDDDSRSGSRRSARGSGRDSGSRNGSKNQTDDGDHDGIYSSSGVNDRSNSSTPQKSSPPSPSSSPSPSPSRRSKSLSVISPKTAPIRNERYRQSISGPVVMSPDKNNLGSPRTIVESVKISPKKIENQSQDNDQNQSQDNSEIIVGNDNQIKSEMKSSSGSTCGVSRSRSYTVSTQQSPFKISPNLPVSSGQIRKLGRDQKKQVEHKEKINIKSDYSENHDNLSRTGTVTGTSIRTRMTERRPTTFIKKGEEVRCNTIKVQVHIALDTFIAASGLQNKSNRGRKQNKNSGIVFKKNGVEDSYREISKSLIPVSINTGDRDRDRDRDNDIKNGKGKEEGKEHKIGNNNNHDTDDDNNDNENHGEKNNVNYEDDFEDHHGEAKAEEKSQLRENEKEQKRAEEKDERNKQIRKSQNQNQDHGDSGPDDDTASVQSHSGFSEFSHLTDHSEEYSSGNQNQKNSVDQDRKNYNKYRKLNIEADKRERLFHKLAPPLNSRQRFLVIMSLLSDVARTLMLSISVLLKHTGAGHEITLRDLIVLFGSPCATIIGKQLLNDILLWLKANRRSELNFKLANQTQTELALQRLFAFWPQLLISVTPEGEMPQSENIGNLNRENCIISRTLSKAGKLFEIDTKSRGKGEKGISTVQDNLHIEEKNNENYDYNKKKIKKVGQVLSMVPVICSVQLVWPDRHSTNKLFRDPDEFQPNVNFI